MSWLGAALHPRPPVPPTGPDGKPKQPPDIPPPTLRLLLGVLGTLLAALSSYLNQYGTSFARADIFGGLSIGQDEGNWLAVAFSCGQITVVVVTAWLSTIVSPRRAIAGFLMLLTCAAVASPMATSYAGHILIAVLHGVGGGALVPLLLTTTLRVLPPYDRVWGFAGYGTVVCLSPLIGELISGSLSEFIGWQTIFWVNLVLNPVALVLVLVGLPIEPIKLEGFVKGADYLGMALFILCGTTLIAALTVGQAFDWFSSPLICTLLAVAAVAFVLLVWQELATPQPLVNLRLLQRADFALGLVLVVLFFFAVQGAAYVLPQYAVEVRSFRELQIGLILIFATIPVIVLAPVTGWLLRSIDARVLTALGFLLVLISNLLSTNVTTDWVAIEFLGPQMLAACGYPLVLVSVLIVSTSTLQPEEGVAGSTLFNVVRTLAGSFGTAVLGGIVTVRERVHSNVNISDASHGALGMASRGVGSALSQLVHAQSFVQAIADAYGWIAVLMLAGLVLLLFVREPRVAPPPAG